MPPPASPAFAAFRRWRGWRIGRGAAAGARAGQEATEVDAEHAGHLVIRHRVATRVHHSDDGMHRARAGRVRLHRDEHLLFRDDDDLVEFVRADALGESAVPGGHRLGARELGLAGRVVGVPTILELDDDLRRRREVDLEDVGRVVGLERLSGHGRAQEQKDVHQGSSVADISKKSDTRQCGCLTSLLE